MSKSEDPGSTRRGNTMPGRHFLRGLQVAVAAAAVATFEWEANERDDDDMAAAVDDVQKCQAVSVDDEYRPAGVDGVCVCGDRMVRRRSQDGRASDRCDGTDVRVDANMPRRRSAISAAAAAAATSSRPLSSDLRSSVAIMKLVRCVVDGCGDGRHSIDLLVPAA